MPHGEPLWNFMANLCENSWRIVRTVRRVSLKDFAVMELYLMISLSLPAALKLMSKPLTL